MQKRNLNSIDYSDLIEQVRYFEQEKSEIPLVRIAFLRNVTIEIVIPYLKYLCYQENLKPSICVGDYDNILQFVMNKNAIIYQDSFDIIIICLKLETLAEKLVMFFSALSGAEIVEECNRIVGFIDKVVGEIRKNTNAAVLVHNFEVPVYPSLGILDYQGHNGQTGAIRRINRELLDVAARYESVFIVDLDLLQSSTGYLSFIDNRLWHFGKAPYTRQACEALANEYMKFIRALKGKAKKCLVLDCDNTLWGGIIGEDGINKIELGRTYPGSTYREFQQAILDLHNRGIMLAICSKNNESDVLEVITQHPDMVLRKEHFILMKINWRDKVTNLKEMALELNIGLDSLVFMDDSDFEINLVRELLPEVEAVQLPEDPSLYKVVLKSLGVFDTLTFSEEDRKRNDMYRMEMRRRKKRTEFKPENLEDYYRYLKMEIVIKPADSFSIPRISQLSQRTNQFNLTTRRYSESEIKECSESKDVDVFSLQLKDRFGDSGIVGVAILRYIEDTAFIDTFLLSCRVIGRGVEEVLLNFCIKVAAERSCEEIVGVYRPTKKNGQVESFYRDHSFLLAGKNECESSYSLSLKEADCSYPDYFKSIKVENSILC